MVRRRGEHGVIMMTAMFFIMFMLISLRYFRISYYCEGVRASEERSELTIIAGESQGTIYDRNMRPLVNRESSYAAAAVPSALDREETACYALDREGFCRKFDLGEPFVFACRKDTPESAGLTVFELPVRYSASMPAIHTIGYISDGKGVTGIEYAYNSILRTESGENSVTYSTDGFGRVLIGAGKEVKRSTAVRSGVVTTLDSDIQNICECAVRGAGKGAVVVTDVYTGDILALVSFPDYSFDDLESAVSDESCPMINRALYSYSVGSIFKLVTACEAIEEGLGTFMYECSGGIDIRDVHFSCHKFDGHGIQSMTEAMTNSCNTFFIGQSRNFDAARFRETAKRLGFGRETYLCAGMTGSAGVLPSQSDIMLPAELANFSFGQGKLSATPLCISSLTCTIANGGELPELRLVKGMTVDGEYTANEKPSQSSRVMDRETASQLREMMISAIRDNKESKAYTSLVAVGAKTSTAQTGRCDEKGEELCHAWITGFFPAYEPKYAVTVLVEEGGYGNESAAPIFKEICENITRLKATPHSCQKQENVV